MDKFPVRESLMSAKAIADEKLDKLREVISGQSRHDRAEVVAWIDRNQEQIDEEGVGDFFGELRHQFTNMEVYK